MENKISNEYIENAIKELEKFLGVKEPIPDKDIFLLIKNGKVKDAIKLIALQFGLPIDISITNVPNDYRSQGGDNQFHSTHLAKVHGSGSEGITAQVAIPSSVPFYGSSALNGYPINVKVSDNCTEHPAAFVTIMAHELSHVLLYSLNHPKKENEFYTDLTAIMQGFQNMFRKGRKITKTSTEHDFIINTTKTQTTTYGYLNDSQFSFACNKINLILKKNRKRKRNLSNELNKFTKLLLKYEKTLFKFKFFLEFLTKNTNKKISVNDGKRIAAFFQLGYVDELDLLLKKYREKREIIQNFSKEFSHYTEQSINQLSIYNNELKTYTNELKTKLASLKKDIRMFKKYVTYKYKIKAFFVREGRDK